MWVLGGLVDGVGVDILGVIEVDDSVRSVWHLVGLMGRWERVAEVLER